jgi:hypothetical protein
MLESFGSLKKIRLGAASEVDRTSEEDGTSEEGRFNPAVPELKRLGNSGGKPPFLTCSILELA